MERLALGKVLAAPLEVKLWPGGPSREPDVLFVARGGQAQVDDKRCILYTSEAADDLLCVDLGGRRILKKKKP